MAEFKGWNPRCDECGLFFSWRDLGNPSKMADHYLLYPDSAYTSETYRTYCDKCGQKQHEQRLMAGNA